MVVRAAALYRCRFGDCGSCFGVASTSQTTFQAVYVNFLVIILAILVVIFSIWGSQMTMAGRSVL